MENEPCGAGLRPQEQFHWKSASGCTEVSPSKKTDPQLTALLSVWLADLQRLWLRLAEHATKCPQPCTIWRGSTHASKVLTKRNFNI